MFISCPRCAESGDADGSTLWDDDFSEGQLKVGDRFVRESSEDPFYCVVCERKGIYCEAEVQED